MTLKLIVLTVLGAVVLTILAEMIVRAWRYRRNRPDEAPFASRLLLLLLLLAPSGAWAQSGWTVENLSGSTFTISRSNTTTAETVLYRTVNISAVAGRHYQAATDTLTFDVGEPSKTVTVTELNPGNNAYRYQTGTQRSYRFEVTDLGGFHLAHCDRSFTTGNSVPGSGMFDIKDVIIWSNAFAADDDGYDANGYKSVSSTYYCTNGTKSYLAFLGAQLRMTLSFEAREVDDAFEYLQLLVDNTNTCDNRKDCSNGDPGNINLSLYMAGFEMNTSSTDTTFRSYTFPVTSVGYNASATDPWGYGNKYPLTKQKFNYGCRATDGRLIIPNSFSTLVLRLNASGTVGSDQWVARNIKAHIQAIDTHNPTVTAVTVNPGKHCKGNNVYVSVAFSEIVTVTGALTLSTSWGTLNYLDGSGSNVLTFSGTIPENASSSLTVTGLNINVNNNITVKDLAGNDFSGSINSNLCSLESSYAWPISYDLDGGTTDNPATYTWETATFTLTNPTREGYTFDGWTGSNGNTPQSTVTIANHTHAPLSYTAHWTPVTYNITYNLADGNLATANPATYNIETANFTLVNPTREHYDFAGWTGTGLDAATTTVTVAQGSHGDRTYTATWTPHNYTITYNLGGGTADNPATYNIETPEFTLANPTREGYTFAGWTGTGLAAATQTVTIAQGSTGHRSYTANWEIITYNITYDYGIDGVSADNPATYTIETPTFTLTNLAVTGCFFLGWTGTGLDAATQTVTIARGSIGDRSYTANWNNLWGVDADHDGTTAERAYVITTPEGLNLLATLVNGSDQYNGFSGTFFKLGADIAYSCTSQWNDSVSNENNYTPIGNRSSDYNRFSGTFDGCGHTVSGIRVYASNDYKGLFGYINGGTVKNVTLSDSRITGRQYVGGIVGWNDHGTVENCHSTATVAIYSRTSGPSPDYHGGIVGYNNYIDATATVSGCTSAATVSGTGSNYGGVVGLNYHATVSRCLALGAVVTAGSYSGSVVGGNSGTVTDCRYRHCTVGGNAQNDLYAVAAGTGVTLAPSGDATVAYPYGGLQLYGSAFLCGDTLYAPQGATVDLTLSHSGNLIATAGTLSGTANLYTLTMPDQDVIIRLDHWGIAAGADGTQEHPYLITTPEGLELLASQVNSGTPFSGTFFKLGANIDLDGYSIPPIGDYSQSRPFQGSLDGDNYTITNMSLAGGDCQGLFGYLAGGRVENLTVSNATLSGRGDYRGVVCGYNLGGTLQNCQVTGSSLADSGQYVGGVVGGTFGGAVVSNCQCTSTTIDITGDFVGGVAGIAVNTTIVNCTASATVGGLNRVGGIVGLLGPDAQLEGCTNSGLVRGIAQVGGLVGYQRAGSGQCSGSNNSGNVRWSAMGGGVCGYAEDTTMLEGCSSVMILSYDTIRIQNVEELTLIRDNVNNGSNSYEGIVIVLDWNLNLGNGWTPIGTPEHPFRGIFDGQDHTINFGIYNESNDYQGFFGYMQGTVKNVNFTQCSVIGRNYVGVIAGYCNGTISNCYSYREKVEGEKYVGGLVGMARYSEIQDCFNGNNIVGVQYVGGIVGDFASCKNDNCYGTMKYDLYGGNVSRCYNYGMVRATGDTSHVGGIAGYTSAEVKHCYNSGIVDGKDFVGGLCGQLDGDNLHHCYNAGHVSATGNNKGAVCGSLNLQDIIYNCFYDRQMCTVQDNNASGYNTLKMTGTALRNALGTDYWSYNDNEYPTLKTTKKDNTYFRISVKPLLLPGNMPVDKVVQPFCGVTGNAPYSQVEWSRYGTATPTVDTIHLADKDSITLLGCGVDTLMVSHPGYGFERLVPIVVAAREATVETVHTCGNSYKWNNKYYYETGFYTCDTCANKQALDLTITPVTITPTPINSTCETTPDGEVLVSVTGGPGNGFRYLWTNSLTGDSIGNTPTLTDIPAGYYSVTMTDSLYSTCSQTSLIILTAVAPVALTIKSCDASKTYDGTALTGNRYVVTEQDFEPDTLPADSFAILVNGDTLRVTFDSNAVNAGTYENKFTYSISNGIDHSCHYNVDTIFGTLSITPRPATIIVNDTSKTYGDEDPVFSGTVFGLVDGDSLGTIHYFRNDNSENVGNYPDILTASCTTPNPNYEVSIDKGDLIIYCRDLLIRTDNLPTDIENRNECYSPSNTDALPSADSIKNLILANNDTLQPDAFQVLTKDSTILANNCDWKWARTYTVKISNPNFCDSTSRVIYVSGGDQTAPVRSINDLWTYGTLPQDACLASFNIDKFFPQDTDLFDDCSQMTITHKDTNTGDDHYGWTIRRSYVVTDACGHTIYDTIEVSGRDMTPPVASNPEVKNNTLWADSAQCLCDSIHVINNFSEIVTLFGLSDECTGNDISLVSSSKTLKTGEHCDYTVIIAYVVADAYDNSTTIYHAQFIQDTTGPTFEIVPHDTTLCVDPDGNYENTVTRVADEITVTNLHDNCTKLQESFSVQSSMDTSHFDFYHPRGYRITQGESDNGVRHYKQLWTVTDSCGNTTYDSISIHVRPLPKITRITTPDQHIIYGNPITEVWIYHQYSDLSITGLSGIGLDSLGCSVEHKRDQNNNEYDRVYGDPEFAVNATFLVTANSHQGWGCSSVDSTFSINVERRPIVITATDATKKYDGTPLTSTDYTCTTDEGSPDDALVHDDVISRLSFSGSQTNVGSSTNTIGNAKITAPNDTTIDKTSSYWIDYYPGTLTVTENDTAITVTAGSGSRFYDGTPFTLTAHDDFIVTGVPDALTWTATADGTVTNIIPGEGEKPLNEVSSFHIFDADSNDVTEYFTNITYQSGTLTVNPVAISIGDGWQAIATPVHDEGETYWTVSSVFTTAPYDLFRYDEPTATWQNYKTHFFTFSPARGYIYRTATDEALIYGGMPNSEASYSIALTAGAPNDLAGWNLVGNPYPFPVHLDCPYYSLLPDGRWEAHDAPVATDSLAMGQAVLVHTTAPATLTFYYATRSTNAPAQAKGPLPALPRGLCLSGDCDRNDAMTQSHNQDFAHWDNGQLIVEGEGTLEAYDVMGRRLFNVEIRNSKFEIQNSVFPSVGVYLLRLAGQSQKIVITK